MKNVALKLGLNLNETNDQDVKSSHLSLSDEFKVGFPFAVPHSKMNCYLETRLRRNGEVKVHLDGGKLVKLLINSFDF